MRLTPAGVIRTGGLDPRGFLGRLVAPRTDKPGAVSALKLLCECCHISASPGLSAVITERCNVHTGWRSATLLESIVWLLMKDHYPPQQGRNRAPENAALCDAFHASV